MDDKPVFKSPPGSLSLLGTSNSNGRAALSAYAAEPRPHIGSDLHTAAPQLSDLSPVLLGDLEDDVPALVDVDEVVILEDEEDAVVAAPVGESISVAQSPPCAEHFSVGCW